MKKLLVLMMVFVLIATSFIGCGSSDAGNKAESAKSTEQAKAAEPAKGSEPIKIGAMFPKSGSNALMGNAGLLGAQIAAEIVNKNGGVTGRQVQIVDADAPDPTAATTEAGRLINQKGVNVIIGSLSSGNALAISAVTEKSNAILWETCGISDELTSKGFKYVFRVIDKGSFRGAYAMKFVKEIVAPKLGIAPDKIKVAVVNEESSYGASVGKGAIDEAKKLGLNVVAHEAYNSKITDMSAMVLKIKAQAPDVIFSVSYVNDAVLLYDTLKQYKAVPKALLGGGAGTTDVNFAKTEGKDADGVFCTDLPASLPLEVFKDEKVKSVVEEFRKIYKEKDAKAERIPLVAEAVFMGTYALLHDVLPNAKSMSRDDIREAALKTKLPLTTLGFGLDLGEDGQNNAAFAAINQWQDGKTKIVYPESIKNGDMINVPLPLSSAK